MDDAARAVILWLPRERGGRTTPPAGPGYTTVARFEDSRDRWPDEAWSMVVDFLKVFGDKSHATLCAVRFQSPQAPSELLTAGARFELCEGARVVAKGVVLPSEITVPPQLDEFALSLLG